MDSDVDTSSVQSHDLTQVTDLPHAASDAPIANRPLTQLVLGALVGASGGFLVGYLASTSYTCNFADLYNCYPDEWLKVGVVAVAGLVLGLVVSRLWPSMTDRQKILMTAATLVLLAMLVISSHDRFNPWSCPPDAFCQVGDAVSST